MLQYMSHTGDYLKNISDQFKNLSPEVDYQALLAQMQTLSHPRRKLKELQNKGSLIRLKKGFYVLTEQIIGKNYSVQIVANLLYGPSYLSLEYALSYYDLIPERVESLTSVTTQKNKNFETAIGHFTYKHLATDLYPMGVTIKKTEDDRNFLIATPEKALMDMFTLKFKNTDLPKKKDILKALIEDLRIDLEAFKQIRDRNLLQEMKFFYRNRAWNRLAIDFLLEY